eukprot:TRINITY_DN5406_c0_g1_i1.p1 TRINITY_DN5406_c0_g1~~TRINITY_DN5406_c0_g1_i1.p1  ORF type:complete len:180 (+),score=32.19 TRINITY_DN5406_c0_g1_i1:614-1153(+)
MTFYRNPFDIIIQQIQVGGISKFGTMDVRRSIKAVMDGAKMKGFYRGYWVTIVRDFGFGFCYFSTYEIFKWLQRSTFGGNHPFLMNVIAGSAAGALGTFLTIPMDVVKTRLQTEYSLPEGQQKYKGTIDAVRKIIRHEGILALTRGLSARLLTTIPAAGITFGAYEFLRDMLSDHRANA